MCCFTFSLEARKKWALIVTALSALVILCGLALLILSILFVTNQDDIFNADFGEVKDEMSNIKNGVFGGLCAFSLIAIITGIAGTTCGCGPCKTGNRCYPIMYGIPLMFVWLVFMIIGGIVTGIST